MKSECNACPFRKIALPGYLGDASYKPEQFLQTMEIDPIPCHLTVKWEKENGNDKRYSNPCIGSLKFLKNTYKMPRKKEYNELRQQVQSDSNIFKTRQEFIDYHTKLK